MIQRLEPCTRQRPKETLNALREPVVGWTDAGTIRAGISAGGGDLNRTNELLRIDSTHTAVTWDAVEVGDRIRPAGDSGAWYVVTYVVPGGRRRMHQLYLRREELLRGR